MFYDVFHVLPKVMVMKGSYSYVGTDGLPYVVDWFADETGFHPSAPHLPQSVLPNHPEVAEAVATVDRAVAVSAGRDAHVVTTNDQETNSPRKSSTLIDPLRWLRVDVALVSVRWLSWATRRAELASALASQSKWQTPSARGVKLPRTPW